MADDSKKPPSIPAWQQGHSPQSTDSDETQSTDTPQASDQDAAASRSELIELAKDFLKDDAVEGEPRNRKAEFLESKGLEPKEIEQLLGPESAQGEDVPKEELKTVFDSNQNSVDETATKTQLPSQSRPSSIQTTSDQQRSQQPQQQPKRDVPPIITYPEFLLKPQKPPPLVTLDRLLKAGYGVAALSALTYATSKYFVEPMRQTLTDARCDFAETTLQNLEKFNSKLESTVSHVPYIASLKTQNHHHQHGEDDDDNSSVDSDPTELFHRDIATQTTPQLSRSPSSTSLTKTHLDATTVQVTRLQSLHASLSSLKSSMNPSADPFLPMPASKKLRQTISEFQTVLDKLESTHNPFRSDYSSIYSTGQDAKNKTNKGDNNEAAKFRAEIRSLKGAFLSSRNFPTARPVSVGSSVNNVTNHNAGGPRDR